MIFYNLDSGNTFNILKDKIDFSVFIALLDKGNVSDTRIVCAENLKSDEWITFHWEHENKGNFYENN